MFQVSVLAALNPSVLHQLYGKDLLTLNKRWRRLLARRAFNNLLKELSAGKLRFMETRGVFYAIAKLPEVQRRSGNDLINWYRDFQGIIINQSKTPRG
jgi:hypothetical protein